MPEIVLKGVTKRFGKSVAVNSLDLVIDDGAFVTLLGPSGCGKTTTLRMIAGLETPTEGEIYIGGNLVFSSEKGVDVSTDKRNIGFLFQNYALWPHMTVRKNITFGLENLKWSKAAINERLEELLHQMHIEEYADRYPSELSGGQQQRVAIARTLASKPSLLLMDEPLSNLDAKLRLDMRAELKKLHAETGSTFVYVTHDQQEAMSLSTRVCLMKQGVLQQYSAPLEVYGSPANMFTADFVGSPSINFIDVEPTITSSELILEADGFTINFTPEKWQDVNNIKNGAKLVLGVRPEMIQVSEEGKTSADIDSSLPYGMETVLCLKVSNMTLLAVVFGSIDFKHREKVFINFEGSKICLFDKETGNLITKGSAQFI